MSLNDSFIQEVSDEVRRDRLFGLFRRYGWVAACLILFLVGGAGINEWRKSQGYDKNKNFYPGHILMIINNFWGSIG